MASIEKTVFISYRRKDNYEALAVYQYLTSRHYDVFLDYTSIPSGDFEQIIVSNIKARAHFVVILTPTALDRCSEPGDWLRREIETAIDEKRNIIPLFFDDFSFSAPGVAEKLTGKLGAIRRYNGLDVPPHYFTAAMERLCDQYLNVPLDAVIHPVPTEVRKAVREERVATDQALQDKKEHIDKLIKPIVEIAEASRTLGDTHPVVQPAAKGKRDEQRVRNWRLYGIVVAVAIGIAGINSFLQNRETAIPTQAVTYGLLTQTSTPPAASRTSPHPSAVSTQRPESMEILAVDGMNLLYVAPGKFMMGSETNEKDELPVHTVFLDAFWIDQTEVTNAMYAKCVRMGPCHSPPRTFSNTRENYYGNPEFDHYPVIHVSWEAANTYCSWVGRRLPTEAQWEKAARGTDGRIYPWGADPPKDRLLNYNHPNDGDTTEVGSYPDDFSPYGAMDMAGNVLEWVADWYSGTYYEISPTANPTGPDAGDHRVFRGGGWTRGSHDIRVTIRYHQAPEYTTKGLGFRCVASP